MFLYMFIMFKYIHKQNYNLSKDSSGKDKLRNIKYNLNLEKRKKEILHQSVIMTNFWL